MTQQLACWYSILGAFGPLFCSPSLPLFTALVTAWVLCPGRRTLTRLYLLAEPHGKRAHDAYHRFVREAAWSVEMLWESLARCMVAALQPHGLLIMDLDDTVYHKTGRKIVAAAWWRDAVRSTGKRVVHCFGLNIVVLTLRVSAPWGGEPLGLPINMRIHRKKQRTLLELAGEMIQQTAGWFADRHIHLCADGFYAPMAGRGLPTTVEMTSRMRRDGALFALPLRRRPHQRGAPRKKGRRLPTPKQMSTKRLVWKRCSLSLRGKDAVRLLAVKTLLWYDVTATKPLLLVVCRDPDGKQPDDYFFTTDTSLSGDRVVEIYSGRWCIEDTFRNVKQYLGAQTPQAWSKEGPMRVAALSLATYSMVWLWYLQTNLTARPLVRLPWYTQKSAPSFQDALARLRTVLWRARIIENTGRKALPEKILAPLLNTLAAAA